MEFAGNAIPGSGGCVYYGLQQITFSVERKKAEIKRLCSTRLSKARY